MCSLGECSPPPPQGYVTVCELNGDLIRAPAGDAADPSKFTQGVQVMYDVKLNVWQKIGTLPIKSELLFWFQVVRGCLPAA